MSSMGMASVFAPPRERQKQDELGDFKDYDANGDGVITREEWEVWELYT